jgi:ribosomal protein S18 acetylase RimI-like enzyme
MDILVRYALREELGKVNELRKMVNHAHVAGRPDIFRPGFCDELKEQIYLKYDSEASDVLVAITENIVCGFAIVEYINKPLSPYNLARSYYHIEEFGVDPNYRRLGAASSLIDFAKKEADQMGYGRIELDMWEFNASALAFYEAAGFKTFRRYMELDV